MALTYRRRLWVAWARLILGMGLLTPAFSAKRIISLSPSLTDMVVDLGRGGWVVGITRYDHNPGVPQAQSVGGWIDPSLDQIVALQPDLVLMVAAQEPFLGPNLQKLGIRYKVLPAQTLSDILTSLDSLGQWLNCSAQARHLKDSLSQYLVASSPSDSTWPSALLIVDHTPGTLQNLYAAGNHTYLHELLILAGFQNVCADYEGYLFLSMEQVIAWDPEVIFEMSQSASPSPAPWAQLSRLRAVQRGWIFFLDPNLFSHPSTRFPQALKKLQTIRESLHADR